MLYLDFAKAFDKVCHERLMVKLEAVRVKGKVRDWLKDWLGGRRQRVRVEGAYSEWEEVASGVVQGSFLGGTLFDIFIDDITEEVKESLVMIFADDTKIARKIHNEEDRDRMQEVIDKVWEWANRWGMTFNTGKCHVMHIGKIKA